MTGQLAVCSLHGVDELGLHLSLIATGLRTAVILSSEALSYFCDHFQMRRRAERTREQNIIET